MFDTLASSFVQLLSGWHLIYLLFGVAIGLVFGILPALGGSAGMAVLLPFVFGMEPSLAMPMMIGMMAVTPTADTFSSVLLGIPGGNGSQSTVLDGFPMSKRGEAARALSAAFTSSLFGGLFGALILSVAVFMAEPLLLMIGFGEQMMLVILAMTMVGTLAGKNPLKGVACCGLGLLFGTIGTAHVSGTQRLTFDIPYLLDGVPLTIVALGIFAIPEIIDLVRRQSAISETGMTLGSGWIEGVKDTFRHWGLVLRCSALGVVIGAMPGLGGSVINWMAYSHAVQTAKDKSQFGKGDVRGVLAPESANNSQDGGHLIPTLLFGIPASGSMALLLSGFILIGIKPGLDMITVHLDLTYTIIWSLALANIFGAGACVLLSQPVARLTTVPSAVIAPFMFALIFFAAAQTTDNWADLVALAAIGTFGVYLRRFGWPRPAFMIGFVLSAQLENSVYRVVQVYQWHFLTRPVVLVLLAIIVISIFFAVRMRGDKLELTDDGPYSPAHKAPQLVFVGLVLAYVLYVIISAMGWNFSTALFPLSAALATLALLVPLAYLMLRTTVPSTLFYDSELEEFSGGIEKHSNEHYMLWLGGYLLLIALVGFAFGSTAFVYIFLRQKAGRSYGYAAMGAGSILLLLAIAAYFLNASYIDGLLQNYVPMPWPF